LIRIKSISTKKSIGLFKYIFSDMLFCLAG
jgi:hypothetical protein